MSNDNVVCKYVVNESESQEIKEAILGLYFIMKAGRDGIRALPCGVQGGAFGPFCS